MIQNQPTITRESPQISNQQKSKEIENLAVARNDEGKPFALAVFSEEVQTDVISTHCCAQEEKFWLLTKSLDAFFIAFSEIPEDVLEFIELSAASGKTIDIYRLIAGE